MSQDPSKHDNTNKYFHNHNFGFTFAEAHENVAEICLFHVSFDVFRTTICLMEPAEAQETFPETDVCLSFAKSLQIGLIQFCFQILQFPFLPHQFTVLFLVLYH